MISLNDKARIKFPRADKMLFSKEALEQASSKGVAEYKTWKMRQKLGIVTKVLDVCAGMGGDTIAMALRWKVIAVEKNPEVFEMLKHNVKVYEVDLNVDAVCGDINNLMSGNAFIEKIKDVDCIFFDPSRRVEGERTVKIEEYEPPLTLIEKFKLTSPNICVKISPGVDLERIKYDCDIEVVSLKGEVKEVLLWFGKFKKELDSNCIIATKLPEKISMENHETPKIALSEPKKFLYEPDPAFIKAELTNELAHKYSLDKVDNDLSYLTSNIDIDTPLLKKYVILAHANLDYNNINTILNKMNIGICDFKARGVDIDLKTIHKEIKGRGKNRGLIIFTRFNSKKVSLICRYADY